MNIRLYNTLTRTKEEFIPIKKGKAGLYTCGPTVYNYAHLGNLRTYIFEDILKRVLQYDSYEVKHVMNITDVGHLTSDADEGEDKMEKGALREGKSAWEIADFYTAAFIHDIEALNILPPTIYCKATEHIKEQVQLIKDLEKKGFTYRTADGIYFDTARLSDYGKLSGQNIKELKAGARVDLGEKKNITDFALWKFSPAESKRQMEWKSPWGVGFPGWHIECSAMSVKYLGQPFDIHCGGIDHIAVHHANEIAQSEAAYGKPLANYWMHGEFLITGTEKMAKSTGNFLTMETLKEKGFSPLAYRYFTLQTHYRKQLAFSWEALQAAQNGLNHLYNVVREMGPDKTVDNNELLEEFSERINDDLDIPGALALIWEAIKNKQIDMEKIFQFDRVLGLKIEENMVRYEQDIPPEIKKIIDDRDLARKRKDWEKSDEFRKQLEGLGYQVEDAKDGTKVNKK